VAVGAGEENHSLKHIIKQYDDVTMQYDPSTVGVYLPRPAH